MPNMGFRGVYAAANSAIGGRILNNDLLPAVRGGFFPAVDFDYLVPFDSDFPRTSLLLKAVGSNTQQNYTILDSSTNNLSITRNGDVTQGSFNPYGIDDGKWSAYFDGSGDNLLTNYNLALHLSGDFTIELWVFPVTAGGLIINRGGGSGIAWASYQLIWADGTYVNFSGSSTNNGYDIGSETGTTGRIGQPIIGQWNHIAVTRDGNVYRGFLNGVLGYTQTLSLTPWNPSTSGLAIGSNYGGTWGTGTPTSTMNGYISNLRIVKGTPLYTSNFTPPTKPLTAVTGTSLLTCQSSRLIDSSPNNITIQRNGNTKTSAFGPFKLSSLYSQSAASGSLYFDGTGDYLSVASGMSVGTNNFTIEAWIYPTAFNTWQSIFSTRPTSSTAGNTDVWALGVNTTGYAYIYSGDFQIQSANNLVSANTWTHLAVTRSGTNMRMFINGVLANTTTTSQNYTQTPAAIGANRDGSEQWTGYISNLRLLNGTALYTAAFTPPPLPLTAITNTTLLLSGTNAAIVDASRKNVANTVGSVNSSNVITKFTGENSMYFNGSTDYITMPMGPELQLGNGNFTIECWTYLISRTRLYPCIFANYNTYTTGSLSLFAGHNNATTTAYQVAVNGESFPTSAIQGGTVIYNQWVHLAVVRSGSTMNLYVNGTSVGSITNSATFNGSGSLFYIGATGDALSNSSINGYLQDFRITKSARYTSNFTPPTTSFQTR